MQPHQAHQQALAHVLWLGGTPCTGKTSVAKRLAGKYALRLYHYDRREGAHLALSRPERHPAMREDNAPTPDQRWVLRPIEEMVRATTAAWAERFAMVVDDLLALPRTPPVLAEGPGLLPECVAPLLTDPRQALWLVPTEAFKRATQPTRGGRPAIWTSDPERAYGNLLALDLRLAVDVKRRAGELGLTVLDVDGARSLDETAAAVARHFAPRLPTSGPSPG